MFGRTRQRVLTPGERLVRRTGYGLAVFTLALIAVLLAIVGIVTAAAVTEMTDQSVDSNLHGAADNMLIALAPTPSPAPTPTPARTFEESARATHENGSGSDDGGDGEHDGTTPRPTSRDVPSPTPTPTTRPTATPIPTRTPAPSDGADAGAGATDRPPEASDTFFLILDTAGSIKANPQHVAMSGLPDAASAAIAAGGTQDWRTVDLAGTRIRLLSEPMHGLDGSISGVLQTGFVLTAHEEQNALIVRTIVLASLAGLIGAALVTLFVTRRAMSPIRAAFEAERRFVASASHELKTPVSIVHASAEILQREDLIKPDGRYLVSDIVSESDRMGLLVGDMLALASAQAGQISVSLAVVDIRPFVEVAVGRVQAVARQKSVRVVVGQESAGAVRDASPLLVLADRERLLQLLTIFIDNAIDHSPANGTVTVVARATEEANRTGRRVVVEVLDQGPGVPVAERERIFEPFARTAGERRTTGTTGLGLAIARILAARQDATIAVTDAPGGGACFSVSFARQ